MRNVEGNMSFHWSENQSKFTMFAEANDFFNKAGMFKIVEIPIIDTDENEVDIKDSINRDELRKCSKELTKDELEKPTTNDNEEDIKENINRDELRNCSEEVTKDEIEKPKTNRFKQSGLHLQIEKVENIEINDIDTALKQETIINPTEASEEDQIPHMQRYEEMQNFQMMQNYQMMQKQQMMMQLQMMQQQQSLIPNLQ